MTQKTTHLLTHADGTHYHCMCGVKIPRYGEVVNNIDCYWGLDKFVINVIQRGEAPEGPMCLACADHPQVQLRVLALSDLGDDPAIGITT